MLAEPPRTKWDLNWRMLGVPVRIHPLFWLTALVISWHRSLHPGLVAESIAIVFISIMVHEFGHALSGRRYGDRHNHVVLHAMGGLCVQSKIDDSYRSRIMVLLWGPLAGFIIAAIAFAGMKGWEYGWLASSNRFLIHGLFIAFQINFWWGILNLLPVFPMDGGQILREICSRKGRGDLLAFTISFYAAIIGAAVFLVAGVYRKTEDPMAFIPVLLFGFFAYESHRLRTHVKNYGSLEGEAHERREAWEQDPDWWKR